MALCLWGQSAAAARDETAGPIRAEVAVDRSTITVGDPIVCTLTVVHDPELKVVLPGAELDGFEVRDYRLLDPKRGSGRVRRGVRYVITSFETGPKRLPSLPVVYTGPAGAADTLHTAEVEIDVESVLSAEAEDIEDIKGPLLPPLDLRPIILAAAAVVLLSVLAGWLYRRYRRLPSRSALAAIPPVPARPPFDIAVESLERIKREGLLSAGRTKEYYSRVADTLRVYIETGFGVPAMELTTPETLRDFGRLHPSHEEPRKTLRRVLQLADLVKFARLEPAIAKGIDCLEDAYRFLEMTRPDRPPPDAEEPAAAVTSAPEGGS